MPTFNLVLHLYRQIYTLQPKHINAERILFIYAHDSVAQDTVSYKEINLIERQQGKRQQIQAC